MITISPRKRKELPDIPLEELSSQQKTIYKMAQANFTNKEIACKLGTEARNVALQLSRIRKKAPQLNYRYTTSVPASHLNYEKSPARELKDKLQNDPGFISLLYQRYGTNQEPRKENKFRLATLGGAPAELGRERTKHLKTIMHGSGKEYLLLKLTREDRKKLKKYLSARNLKPLETYWDDGSAVYKMTPGEFKEIQQKLSNEENEY